jgi:endonuclease/exonuclease/phosphatase family metal-dependent hydrolase
MIIRCVQWNIGGGKITDEKSDRSDDLSYSKNDLDYIVNILKSLNPDIITLQEVHVNGVNQAELIAKELNMQNLSYDKYDKSHLEEGQWLSQAIITRFPIESHDFIFFTNPNVDVHFGNKVGKSHDKGITSVTLNINGEFLAVKTLHMIPFRRTGLKPNDPIFEKQNSELDSRLDSKDKKILVQADFNYDSESLSDFINSVKDKKINEVIQTEPTTPEGQRYDHVLFRGIELTTSKVIKEALTDHLPIVSEFELK